MKFTQGYAVVAASIFLLSTTGLAQETSEPSPAQEVEGVDKADQMQHKLTNLVRFTANSVDNFFSTDRHSWGDNKTRVTLRGNFDWVDKHGWEFNPELRLNLALPGLGDRLRVVANEDDDDGAGGGSAADDQESNLALRFVGSVSRKQGISFDVGLSTRGDETLQGFGRVNLFRNWKLTKTWDGRAENRLYYYTNSGLRNDFRWFFEHRLNEKFFFRSRTRFDYLEDRNKEWYPEQRFTLFHQITNRTAVAYELAYEEVAPEDSPWDPDEVQILDDRYTHYYARLRFRQNIGYPWLFYEVWPTAAWAEEQDYDFVPAIRFRLEVVLGDPPKTTRLGMN